MLLLAPLRPDDSEPVVVRKIGLVAQYLDILLTWRLWNFRTIAYSTMQYAMFVVMRDIRGLVARCTCPQAARVPWQGRRGPSPATTACECTSRTATARTASSPVSPITWRRSPSQPSRYLDYVSEGKTRYEVEHIWADHPGASYRRVHPSRRLRRAPQPHRGGLLLLPKSFNASYGDLIYADKLPHYHSARTCWRARCILSATRAQPGFVRFKEQSGLPFQPHAEFNKADLEQRSLLLPGLAERIWNPANLLKRGVAMIADLTACAGYRGSFPRLLCGYRSVVTESKTVKETPPWRRNDCRRGQPLLQRADDLFAAFSPLGLSRAPSRKSFL